MRPQALTRPLVTAQLRPVGGAERDPGFEHVFLAEYERVTRVAARILGDWSAAEDVAQECFLRLHQRHPGGLAHAAAWLHLGAARAALNRARSERRRVHRETRHGEGAAADDPETLTLRAETRREVRAALARLPTRKAAVLALRYSGLSYQEVADGLGVGVNQVGSLLRRAEAALLQEVRRDAGTPQD
ncbi:MAG TPA: sigma-70 family RNA polymerase sigma factor [Candidatus Micrarchaeia archaeon]|nr:sigma-70 family RNA polymerase sigma factor [Candidatus Micrarchaeia archaeon]